MYVILQDGTIFDYDLDFLSPLLATFDAQLAKVRMDTAQNGDKDQFELLDRLDYLAGVGFTACQQYISATHISAGMGREDAFALGPRYRDRTIIELVNAGANYWKHHEEWPFEPEKRRRSTTSSLRGAGVDTDGAYVCSDLIDAMVGVVPEPFECLKQHLIQWRRDLIAATKDRNAEGCGRRCESVSNSPA